MKVLITTMHRGNNYGSALQTYALSEKVKDLGGKPIVLDYIPTRINNKKLIWSAIVKLLGINSFRDKYNAIRTIAILTSSYWCYNRFFKREVVLTKRFTSLEKIQAANLDIDIYMTGSDQVWNSFHNNGIESVFYLSFAPDDKRKVAYAASFGRKELEHWEINNTRRLLSRYDTITVREQTAVKVLESIGLSGQCVLDPTFLLNKDEWISRSIPHHEKDKYVLIYSVEPDKASVIKIARSVANRIGAKVYMVEWGRKPYSGVDKMISLVDPLMLIDYFAKAEFIIASSFHGTALSLNLNRPFISVSPAKFNTRVQSILSIVDEESRLINPEEFDIENAITPIDYIRINRVLNQKREFSIKMLKNIIQ